MVMGDQEGTAGDAGKARVDVCRAVFRKRTQSSTD